MNDYKIKLYKAAIDKWGLAFQALKTSEEVGELLQALSKVCLGKWNKERLAEEIADVSIMLEQLKVAYDLNKRVVELKEIKLKRLEERLKE